MIKAILIDDEKAAIKSMKSLLDEYFDYIKVIGTAGSVSEGKDLLKRDQPDIIFLDIEMNDGTGFDLLDTIDQKCSKVIFVTAYSEYAIQAIKKRAFDYLLKPIEIDELKSAMEKVRTDFADKNKQYASRISIASKKGNRFIKTSDIICAKANGSYCELFLSNNERIMLSENLKHLENQLNPGQFYRCHHSNLINLSRVTGVVNELGMCATLEEDHIAEVSKRKRNEFYEKMEAFSLNH